MKVGKNAYFLLMSSILDASQIRLYFLELFSHKHGWQKDYSQEDGSMSSRV